MRPQRAYWAFLSGGHQPNIPVDPFTAIVSLKDVLLTLLLLNVPPEGVIVLQCATETEL